MGNYVNKLFSHDNENEKENTKTEVCKQEASCAENMCTPPVTQRKLPVDPRSITIGIDRTPIEINCTPVGLNKRISAIPRHLQTKPYLETDIDKVMPQLTPKKRFFPKTMDSAQPWTPNLNQNSQTYLTPNVNIIRHPKKMTPIEKERYEVLGLDPRSPAADFDRTPILMPRSIERIKARSQENLSRRGSYETDMYCSRFSYCEMSSQFNVPEIQALPDMAMNAVKSLNLVDSPFADRLNKSDSCCSHSSRIDSLSENGEEITIIENPKLNNADSNEDICTTSPSLIDQEAFTSEEEKFDDGNMIRTSAKQNIYSERIKVWRDSLSLDEPEEIEEIGFVELDKMDKNKTEPEMSKEEVIITFNDDSIAKDALPQNLTNVESDYQKKVGIGKKKKIVKPDIKITTDEKKIISSDIKNINESSKTRTPLGNRSNNGQIQTLSTKSPQQLFRNKGIIPKILQENTPPHKRCIIKSKLSGIQWDPDSTVII